MLAACISATAWLQDLPNAWQPAEASRHVPERPSCSQNCHHWVRPLFKFSAQMVVVLQQRSYTTKSTCPTSAERIHHRNRWWTQSLLLAQFKPIKWNSAERLLTPSHVKSLFKSTPIIKKPKVLPNPVWTGLISCHFYMSLRLSSEGELDGDIISARGTKTQEMREVASIFLSFRSGCDVKARVPAWPGVRWSVTCEWRLVNHRVREVRQRIKTAEPVCWEIVNGSFLF